MQPTASQIDEQVKLERDQIAQGLKRLHDDTRRSEERSYASACVYGIASIDMLLPLVVKRIEDTNNRIKEGKNGVAFKEIQQYISGLEPLAAAAITCKLTFDKVFGYRDKSNLLANVLDSIGQAVEDECHMRHYEEHAPGLLNVLKKNYWHKACGTQQKITVISTLMNRCEVKKWKAWGRTNRIRLGGWLLDCLLEASGWFEKECRREGKRTVNYVVPTAEFLKIKDEVMANAELFSPLTWPMLIPPNKWSNHERGGYLLNEVMRGHELIRHGDHLRLQGETPLAFLNHIQKVAYTLNPFIVDVAETLQKRGISVGKFLPIVDHPLPPKPVDIADNEDSRMAYRRAAAEVRNKNAQEFKRSCRTRMTMGAVSRFKDVDRFYIPWSFDYRGRAYPIPAFLTPQDTDFGKSLLKFADDAFLTDRTEEWLAFQVATTYGKDKDTWKDRQKWVKNNLTLIKNVALDPIGNRPEWENAEEPWQFLAACDEYFHCILVRDRPHTSLMVAVDATCSGLQILAGLAKDKSTAKLVNVLPSNKPQDAYAVVAETAKPNCPKEYQYFMDRKVVKRTVMTVPYNAKPFSNRSYIRDALKEKGIEIDKDNLSLIVKAVRGAMNTVVPGPMAVMKWIETEVAKAIARGQHGWVKYPTKEDPDRRLWKPIEQEFEWVTPSGFVVRQKMMKKDWEILDLKLLGRCQIKVATDDTDEVDTNRHKAATAPNLIHSLDASLLHLSIIKFNAPIALIHDSVLSRATDMPELSTLIRQTYMQLFADHDYLTDFAKQIGAETKPPIIGDLDASSVIDSDYFFC